MSETPETSEVPEPSKPSKMSRVKDAAVTTAWITLPCAVSVGLLYIGVKTTKMQLETAKLNLEAAKLTKS